MPEHAVVYPAVGIVIRFFNAARIWPAAFASNSSGGSFNGRASCEDAPCGNLNTHSLCARQVLPGFTVRSGRRPTKRGAQTPWLRLHVNVSSSRMCVRQMRREARHADAEHEQLLEETAGWRSGPCSISDSRAALRISVR